MRKIKTLSNDKGAATIYRDSEWQEWVVMFEVYGKGKLENATYYTSGKDDAFDTAQYFLANEV